MKRTSKWMASFFVLVLLLALMATSALAAEIVASGECGNEGDNLTWTLDADGVLTIDGFGGMYASEFRDWEDENEPYVDTCPWRDYCQAITHVILPEGLEWIADNAFALCENLSEIAIPGSVESIGEAAFNGCTGLETVVIHDGVWWIEQGAFSGCTSLKSIYIPSSVKIIDYFAFNECGPLDIYYGGDRADWESIEMSQIDYAEHGFYNESTIHFNSNPPSETIVAVITEEPAAAAEEPAAAAEEPAAAAEEPAAATEEPAAATEEPAAATEEPAAATEEPAAVTEEPAAATKEPAAAPSTVASPQTGDSSTLWATLALTFLSVGTCFFFAGKKTKG